MAQPLARPGEFPDQEPPAPTAPLPERVPTPGETAQGALDAALRQAAIQDEQQAADAAVQAALQGHLEQRVVALNMERRVRDERIGELEAQVAELQAALAAAQAQEDSGEDGPTETPAEHVADA